MEIQASVAPADSSRWRARKATPCRRRGTGRSRRVTAASRRSGRNGRRAGSGEALFLNFANLAGQSHAIVLAWWSPCIIRPHCAAAGRRLWRRWSTAGPWEVRLGNLARQSSCSLSCGKRFLSRRGLIAAAGRRRADEVLVERCRCACHELFFMLCLAGCVNPAVCSNSEAR